MANPTPRHQGPDRRLLRRGSLAAALLGLAQQCVAAFGVGYLDPCATFTTCDVALASGASWSVGYTVTAATDGFVPFYEAPTGTALYQGSAIVRTAEPVSEGRGQSSATSSIGFFAAGARAQTDFGLNRAEQATDLGMGGVVLQNSLALDSAQIAVRTSAEASSAWRDVWNFSGNGHFSAVITVDGKFAQREVPYLPPTSLLAPISGFGDWFYDLRVWDVTHLSVSDDFELGGPTLVARVSPRGNDERRANFAASAALDFDFMSDTSYVVTAELRVTGINGHNLDMFNTARLHDVTLTGGADLVALSGHDWLAGGAPPVPEPSSWALLLAGLLAVGCTSRRRRG